MSYAIEKIVAEMAAATDALESSNDGIEGWRIDQWIAELRRSLERARDEASQRIHDQEVFRGLERALRNNSLGLTGRWDEIATELLRRCESYTDLNLPLGFISKFDHDYIARGGIGQCQVVIHARRPRKDAVPVYIDPRSKAE